MENLKIKFNHESETFSNSILVNGKYFYTAENTPSLEDATRAFFVLNNWRNKQGTPTLTDLINCAFKEEPKDGLRLAKILTVCVLSELLNKRQFRIEMARLLVVQEEEKVSEDIENITNMYYASLLMNKNTVSSPEDYRDLMAIILMNGMKFILHHQEKIIVDVLTMDLEPSETELKL